MVDSPQVALKVDCSIVDDINDSLVLALQTNGDVDSCCVVMQLSTACSVIQNHISHSPSIIIILLLFLSFLGKY